MTDSLEILRINEKITNIERRLDSIEKYSELIYKDRELIVEIQGSVAHLKSMMVANQEHQDNNVKSTKAEIGGVQDIVEAKIDQVHETLDNKTMVIKSPSRNIFEKVKSFLKKGGEKL